MTTKHIAILGAGLACLAADTTHAGYHVWTGAVSGLWSNSNNWQSASAPAIFETPPVIVTFPTGISRVATTNDIGGTFLGGIYGLSLDGIFVLGNNYSFNGKGYGTNLYFTGNPVNVLGVTNNLYCPATNITFSSTLNLVFENTNTIFNNAGSTLDFQASLLGVGGWTFEGQGKMTIDGVGNTTSTGYCEVVGGTVVLNRSSSGLYYAIGGPLIIGTANTSVPAKVVESNAYDQLYNNVTGAIPVTVAPSGSWFISGTTYELVSSLTMTGGVVSLAGAYGMDLYGNGATNYGQLLLQGPLTTSSSASGEPAIITGHGITTSDVESPYASLQLTLDTNVINVTAGNLFIDSPIYTCENAEDPFTSIVKTGAGTLVTTGTNQQAGSAYIEQGAWAAGGDTPFGPNAFLILDPPDSNILYFEVVVSAGAELVVANAFTSTLPLTLNGFGTNGTDGALHVQVDGAQFQGGGVLASDSAIVVTNAADTLTFAANDSFGGSANFHKQGPGSITANGFYMTGTTYIDQGTLNLNGDQNQTAVAGPLVIGTIGSSVDSAVVLMASQQIASNAPVAINNNGILDLGGYAETIGSLTMSGGIVGFGNPLILYGDIYAEDGPGEPEIILSNISLGGTNRNITVSNGSDLILNADISDGGNNAGITIAGPGEVDFYGSNSYGGLTLVNSGRLSVFTSFALDATSGGTIIANGAELDLNNGVSVGNEALSITGAGTDGLGALKGTGTNSWAGPITFLSNTVADIETNSLTLFSGVLAGNSASTFTKSGPGTLEYNGISNNTFAGSTTVLQGLLLLSKTNDGALALEGPLLIGASTNSGTNSEVRLLASYEVGADVPVTINYKGLLNLTNSSTTIGPLALNGGSIQTGTGLLLLNGNVTAGAFGFQNPIYGFVSLGGSTRTFNFATNAICIMQASLSDGGNNAGLIVTCGGGLFLDNSNSFNGTAIVAGGILYVENSYALGSTNGGTIVSNGATLILGGGVNVGLEPLSISGVGGPASGVIQTDGTNSWAGPITLASQCDIVVQSPGQLTLTGTISGPGGLQIDGGGMVTLANSHPNNYAGPTIVDDGVLQLAAPNGSAVPGALTVNNDNPLDFTNTVRWMAANYQLSSNATITLSANSLMDLNNYTDTIGSLIGSGNLNLGVGSLTIGANNASNVFSGAMTGLAASSLFKTGSGTLNLAGNGAGLFSGLGYVAGGTLLVSGTFPQASFDLGGGILGGSGTVGPINQSFSGGYLNPGNPGALNASNLALTSSSTFVAALNGPAAGTNYSQLNVTGSVSLGNATLQLSAGFTGASNSQYILINNNGAGAISGTFAGLPEGATVTANNGAPFTISYHGGNGKDVVLTQSSPPSPPKFSTITKLAGGSIQLSGNGASNVVVTVLATTNLNTTNWTSIGVATNNATGSFQFIDPNAANYMERFYKLSEP